MPHFNAYLFDLDGTLIDTIKTFETLMADLGWLETPLDPTEIFLCGVDSRALIDYRFGREVGDIGPMHAQLIKLYHDNMADVTFFYPYARELLSSLRARGAQVGIISNKDHSLCMNLQEHFNLDLDIFLGSGIVGIKKPHPAPLLYACRELNRRPQDCFYLGDMPSDIEAARYSCMPVGFARYGGYLAFDKDFHFHREIDKLEDFHEMVAPNYSPEPLNIASTQSHAVMTQRPYF